MRVKQISANKFDYCMTSIESWTGVCTMTNNNNRAHGRTNSSVPLELLSSSLVN